MFMLVTLILLSNFKVIYKKRLHSTNEKANNMELINELNYMGKSQEKPNEMEVWGYTIAKRKEKLTEKTMFWSKDSVYNRSFISDRITKNR